MGITQSLNSKANVKKITSNDIPASAAQPVLAYQGPTASTASQTVINLTFSIDTVNAPQLLWLMVDGKKLVYTQDYNFTSIRADGTSSQVTLTAPLAAGLNIEAYKLGLKKEAEFQMDNRFVALYEAEGQGFQGFVNTANVLSATSGTPSTGQFYSSIPNRASIVDFSQDLKARMGVERIMTQQIYQIQNEFGPNVEFVWGIPNDTFGQIRFVGNWTNTNNTTGTRLVASATTDFCEITFYGTGLNVLLEGANTATSNTYSVDGGSSSTLVNPNAQSNILGVRNYSTNQIINVISGLSLGTHTVKIVNAGTGLEIYGFEILNESSSVKVQPGVAYVQGQKYTSSSQSAFAYNSVVTGTKGGRVLVYQKSDGSIGQAFQAVNATQLNVASADHTNEEIVRRYGFRDFGANRSDDFSTLTGSASNRAFTLDDGTTTLVGNGVTQNVGGSQEAFYITTPSSNYFVFTFVGTGLDIVAVMHNNSTGNTPQEQITIDGTVVGSPQFALSSADKVLKIVSGLPYGTHTVKIAVTASGSGVTGDLAVKNFIVYQPKKPSLPSGAIELADYNVMANYVAAASNTATSTGVLRKASTRELTYVGSFSIDLLSDAADLGFNVRSTTSGDSFQYTFFGTGLELIVRSASVSASINVKIDGTNYAGAATVIGSGGTPSWTPGTSTYAPGTVGGNRLQISGLTLGLHTVLLTKNNGTDSMVVGAIDIITPIHFAKSNSNYVLQNTLNVGSCAISDNRSFTPVKGQQTSQKYRGTALGVTSGPTSTASLYTLIPEMSLSVVSKGGWFQLSYNVSINNSTSSSTFTQIFVDGIAEAGTEATISTSSAVVASQNKMVYLSAGIHKIDVYGKTNGGTITYVNADRTLSAQEL